METYVNSLANVLNGQPIAGATVTVLSQPGGTTATIFEKDGTTAKANPFTTPASGRIEFSAAAGEYDLTFGGAGAGIASIEGIRLTDGTGAISQTTEEANSSSTVTNSNYEPGNVLRYGIVSDDTGERTNNTTKLQALCDNTVTNGYKGKIIFPDRGTYHFDGRIACRPGLHFDLMGSTLNFTRTGDATDTQSGAIQGFQDLIIENGTIEINYTHTAGTGTYSAIRLGGRAQGATDFPDFFENLAPYTNIGNIVLRNLFIDYTNADSPPIAMLGGLRDVRLENIEIEGNGTAPSGISYEFGWATNEANDFDRETSHASNLVYRNIIIRNLDDTVAFGIRWGGAYNGVLENIYIRGALNGIFVDPGESMNFNPADPRDLAGVKRNIKMRNIVCAELEGGAITVTGFNDNTGGFLAGLVSDDADKVDLYDFSIDGFSLVGGGASTTMGFGIASSAGRTDIRNGIIVNGANSIRFGDEAVFFNIDNVKCFDDTATVAFRLAFAEGVYSPERKKTGRITNCHIAGTAGQAINIDHTENVLIANNRFGYETAFDNQAETTQTQAVSIGTDADGVVCQDNYVAAVTSGDAYGGSGSDGRGTLIRPRGVITASTAWRSDGRSTQTFNLNANNTITVGTNDTYLRNNSALTANRTQTLSNDNAIEGSQFHFTHDQGGAFTMDIGGLYTIPISTNANVHVMHNGSAWTLISVTTWT